MESEIKIYSMILSNSHSHSHSVIVNLKFNLFKPNIINFKLLNQISLKPSIIFIYMCGTHYINNLNLLTLIIERKNERLAHY